MDEVYTCICGGQTWSIHEGFIRCSSCNKQYGITAESPTNFNESIEKREKK